MIYWIIFFPNIIEAGTIFPSLHDLQQSPDKAASSSSVDLQNCLPFCCGKSDKGDMYCKENCTPSLHPNISPRIPSHQKGKGLTCQQLPSPCQLYLTSRHQSHSLVFPSPPTTTKRFPFFLPWFQADICRAIRSIFKGDD